VHAFEFLRLTAEKACRAAYALIGEEPFLREEVLRAVQRSHEAEVQGEVEIDHWDGGSASLADVLDAIREVPLFARRRLVVVDDADEFVSAHRRELEQAIEHPAPTGVLVLGLKSLPSTTRLARLISARGLIVDCKPPPPSAVASWLIARARDHLRVRLDADAAQTLVELVGPEVGLQAMELEKLAVSVGTRAQITRADVTRMVAGTHVETVWKVLDAATTGRTAEALSELDALMASGEHPVGLLAAMAASLRKVHRAGTLRLSRTDPAEACRTAGIPPFAVQSTLTQHTHLGPTRVRALPALLLRADLDLKGGSQLAPRTVLERLVVELARPRSD
jgi:DNA polymerase-3 subunit delta